MVKLELLKRISIKDKNGKIRYDSGLVPSNSHVVAYLEHLYSAFSDLNISIEDTSNTAKVIRSPLLAGSRSFMSIDGTAGTASYGIVVGTGTTAESNTDYALATLIAHGTGSGQLQYSSSSLVVPTVVSGNIDLVVSRTFVNGSGASITVNEIGVYCKSWDSNLVYFCIVRDVLTIPQAVANGETMTVQYTVRTTV